MRILTFLSLSLAAVLSLNAAWAKSPSANAFLHSIYSHYRGDDGATGKGIFLDTPKDIRRYFAPDLAEAIIADDAAAAKRGDVPALDGDPFVDAQDWDITDIAIHVESDDGKSAKARVTFRNFNKPVAVRLALVMTDGGWRIADIVWPGKDGSLRGLYKR